MKSKTSRHCLKRLSSLLLAVALCIGMMPGAFAAQENGYHDPAEHWQEANGTVKKTAHPTCPIMPPVLVLTATVSA